MATPQAVTSEIKVDKVGLREHYLTLTACQRVFARLVVKWIRDPKKTLVVVSGGPGTGKSYVVKNTLDLIHVLQIRMSFTARSAQSIGGRTIHSAVGLNPQESGTYRILEESLKDEEDFSECVKQSQAILNHFKCSEYPYVVVLDEVAMINGWLTYWLIRFFMDRTDLPLLFVCMGDRHQLSPIKSKHNLFSVQNFEENFNVYNIQLKESKRFTADYEKIINALRDFVDRGDEDDLVEFIWRNFPVVEDIDATLLMQADRAMAFTRERVKKWNLFYLKNKLPGTEEVCVDNNLVLKPGCLVFVTRNGCSVAMNGTKLIFDRYDPQKDQVICKDPKTNLEVTVMRSFQGTFPLELGFAGTVHKYQGDTIEEGKIVISFDKQTNSKFVYTALSRVRKMEQLLGICL